MDDVITAQPKYTLTYETRDLYEAAVLHSLGHAVIDMKKDAGVCYFVFAEKFECERLVTDYRNKILMVNGKSFTESIKTMKDFIYSDERRG